MIDSIIRAIVNIFVLYLCCYIIRRNGLNYKYLSINIANVVKCLLRATILPITALVSNFLLSNTN